MMHLIKTSALALGACVAMAATAQAQSFGYGASPCLSCPPGRCTCPPGACAAGDCGPYGTGYANGFGSTCVGGACGTTGYAPYGTQGYRPSLSRPTQAVSYGLTSYHAPFPPAGNAWGTFRPPVYNGYRPARHW